MVAQSIWYMAAQYKAILTTRIHFPFDIGVC